MPKLGQNQVQIRFGGRAVLSETVFGPSPRASLKPSFVLQLTSPITTLDETRRLEIQLLPRCPARPLNGPVLHELFPVDFQEGNGPSFSLFLFLFLFFPALSLFLSLSLFLFLFRFLSLFFLSLSKRPIQASGKRHIKEGKHPLWLIDCFQAPRHGGKRPLLKRPIERLSIP